MKNKLSDLNNHLFQCLERLNDPELTDPEKIAAEVKKSKAVAEVGEILLEAGRLEMEFIIETGNENSSTFFANAGQKSLTS